jgi:hypothetical protein
MPAPKAVPQGQAAFPGQYGIIAALKVAHGLLENRSARIDARLEQTASLVVVASAGKSPGKRASDSLVLHPS